MARGALGRYAELLGVVMRSENLDKLPETDLMPKRSSLFSRLMKSERLPFDPEVPRGRPSPQLSGLLGAEPLPMDARPEPRRGRVSFFATLFSGETLPADPVPAPGPDGRGQVL